MNPKKARLLHEGFSITTLENLNESQINLLYEKVKKSEKETKEATTKTITSTTYSPGEAKGKSFQGTTTIKDDGSVEVTKEGEVTEKALSKKQQQFFGIVRGMQKGDIPKKGKAGKAAKDIDPEDVKDFASTKHKGLPTKKTDKKETKEDSKKSLKKLEENILRLLENDLPPHTTKGELLKTIKSFKR
jgi:hypothetical protein